MYKKWLAFLGMLGLIILLDPTPTPAQPGGKRDGGKGGPSGGTPGGGWGAPPGGGTPGGTPGGWGSRTPGGGTPGGGTPGGGWGAPPGGGGFTPGGGTPGGGWGAPPGGGTPGGGWGAPPGGGGFTPGGGGMGGGRRIDPEMAWGMLLRLTGGQGDSVDLGAIPPETAVMLKNMTERAGGIPLPSSGVMTKQQFLDHFARSETQRASFSGGGAPGGGFQPGGGWGAPGGGGWGAPGGFGQGPQRGEPKQEEEPKPIALRYGTLPYDKLPSWFKDLDTDKDGQIALYEWRKSKDMKEFLEMDLNGDGVVTSDEYLRYARQKKIDDNVTAYENGDIDRSGLKIGTPLDTKGTGEKTDSKTKGWGTPTGWGTPKSEDRGKGDKGGKGGKGGWGK